jgi:hypothetical protein
LLPKLSPRGHSLLADNALSHPEQISGYLASIARLDRTAHMVLNVGKGLSVAFRLELARSSLTSQFATRTIAALNQ